LSFRVKRGTSQSQWRSHQSPCVTQQPTGILRSAQDDHAACFSAYLARKIFLLEIRR
jgi:hypothetical protein